MNEKPNHDITDEILSLDKDPLRSFPRTTSERTFYMVFGGEPSRKVHYDFPSALSECQRLSQINPGRGFFVLQSILISKIEIPPVKTERLVE